MYLKTSEKIIEKVLIYFDRLATNEHSEAKHGGYLS